MHSIFERNERYMTAKMYEGKYNDRPSSNKCEKGGSDVFFSSIGYHYPNSRAKDEKKTGRRGPEINVIIIVVFFYGGSTTCLGGHTNQCI